MSELFSPRRPYTHLHSPLKARKRGRVFSFPQPGSSECRGHYGDDAGFARRIIRRRLLVLRKAELNRRLLVL